MTAILSEATRQRDLIVKTGIADAIAKSYLQ